MPYKEFDWDEDKYNINLKKHGVTFEEASTTFEDIDALILYDDLHYAEDRFVIIGFSEHERMLFVSHCYKDENVIRIISARKATRAEHKKYHAQF